VGGGAACRTHVLERQALTPAWDVTPVEPLRVGEGEERASTAVDGERRQEGRRRRGDGRARAVADLGKGGRAQRPCGTDGGGAVQQPASPDPATAGRAQEYFTVQP
jgi:hypothetical protein